MRSRLPRFAAAAVAALALWVMPSGGSQGQGTFGDRFSHSDQSLFAPGIASEQLLQSADRQASQSVIGL